MHGIRDVGFLPKSRAQEDLALELEGGLVKVPGEVGVLHEAMEGGLEMVSRAITSKVNKVYRARAS